MKILEIILLLFLIVCAITAVLAKRTLVTVLIFDAFGLIMSVIWILLQAPDLAITEAAVGAGINGLLLYITLKKVRELRGTRDE